MKIVSQRALRRTAAWLQAAVMLSLPFVKVQGESVLRFDIPSLKLYFFGSVIWIEEAYFFLLVFLLLFFGGLLFTVLYGRLWCGWVCPQTVLSDFTRDVDRPATGSRSHGLGKFAASHMLLLIISMIVAADLIWYFVSPYDMLGDLAARSLGPWTFLSWVFISALVYLDLSFVRQKFCGSVCPYARSQALLLDDHTPVVGFDRSRADECLRCGDCVRVCPAGIDIRDGLQAACINCTECIDACSTAMGTINKDPLVRYTRGSSAERGLRMRVIVFASMFALLAVLFAYQVYVRVPLDLWVTRDEPQTGQQTGKKGSTMNVYSVIVENRSLEAEVFRLSIAGISDARLIISRNPFLMPPNTALRMKVSVLVNKINLTYRVTQLRFILENVASPEIRIEQESAFVYPARTEQGLEI